MLVALLPALIALAGLVIYLLASNPKAVEVGRLMLLSGLIAVCLVFARSTVHLLPSRSEG